MPADVFVSYARKDEERVLPWLEELQRVGISVWRDKAEIRGALQWREEIVEAIGGCKVLLLMISAASMGSEHVLKEAIQAASKRKPILPLLLEAVEIPKSLQYDLEGIHRIELFHGEREEQRRAILRSLAALGVAVAEPERAAEGEDRREVASPTPGPPPEPARHNLPRQLTRFIGREREIAEVRRLLADTALLTLTGTGGTGKTRLALQAATELLDEYPGGVWLVELAALMEPELVPQTVASALGVREQPDHPLIETLTSSLQSRNLLLVLDNCEHLAAAAASLVYTLLRACSGMRVLATSRASLEVSGEIVYRVPSLSTPDPRRVPPLERLVEYEAVRLFIDRAQQSRPSYAVTAANARAVAGICHRLDGIPLAIELAAARVRMLSAEQIMARLDDRFKLLTGHNRTVLPRQQTLRALIDWSYDLLSDEERLLFRRLSVFAGGFALEAAEAVCAGEAGCAGACGDPLPGIEPYDALDLLGQLVEKSLIIVEPGEQSRYRLLETIRQYGEEKLKASGEAAVLRERHRDWYLQLAEQAEPELRGPAQEEWLERLDHEHDDLRAALGWSVETGAATAGLRLGGALAWFWFVRGFVVEGREWLARLLALGGASDEPVRALRAKALNGAGVLAISQRDYAATQALYEQGLAIAREVGDQKPVATFLSNLALLAQEQDQDEAARALYEEGLAIWQELGEKRGIAYSLHNLGIVTRRKGDEGAAQDLFEESLAIKRELGDQWGIATSLQALGNLATDRSEYQSAQALYAESLAIARELGDPRNIAYSLSNLGNVAFAQGEYETACARHEESLAIWRELDDREGIAYSLCNLGTVLGSQGNCPAARARLAESLAMFQALGQPSGLLAALKGFAGLAAAEGQQELAARLLGAADGLRAGKGTPRPAAGGTGDERVVAAVRAGLGEEAFAAAWAAGRAMSLEEAVAEALGGR
jgi:predicted ATPase